MSTSSVTPRPRRLRPVPRAVRTGTPSRCPPFTFRFLPPTAAATTATATATVENSKKTINQPLVASAADLHSRCPMVAAATTVAPAVCSRPEPCPASHSTVTVSLHRLVYYMIPQPRTSTVLLLLWLLPTLPLPPAHCRTAARRTIAVVETQFPLRFPCWKMFLATRIWMTCCKNPMPLNDNRLFWMPFKNRLVLPNTPCRRRFKKPLKASLPAATTATTPPPTTMVETWGIRATIAFLTTVASTKEVSSPLRTTKASTDMATKCLHLRGL